MPELFSSEVGEFCEGLKWSICSDSVLMMYSGSGVKPCHHCVEITFDDSRWDHQHDHHGLDNQKQYVCPFVVMASNEGGCNSTAVCLKCIQDAAQQGGW